MLSIPEKNETIYNVILNAITKQVGYRLLIEFGYYKYQIFPELNENKEPKFVIMAFSSPDFKKIYEYSGKEFIKEEFKNFEIEENIQFEKETFDIGIKVNIEKFNVLFDKKKKKDEKKKLTEEEKKKKKEEEKPLREELKKISKEAAEKLSTFRIKYYSSLLDKMLLEVKEGKKLKSFEINLNSTNKLYILPSSDRIQLIYGIDFTQSTDVSLASIFCQELKEAKRHVKNCIDAKCYVKNDDNIPNSIMNLARVENFSNGLVVFDLYVKDYEQIKKKLSYFITFREYIQFHIHSIKTFLHIRMNKKGKELEQKLLTCRIVPDEYLKNLEVINFYTNWNKKEENLKLFAKESKKINV